MLWIESMLDRFETWLHSQEEGQPVKPVRARPVVSDPTPLRFTKSKLIKGEWLQNPDAYLMLDTETTGRGKQDEVIQLALVTLNGTVVYEKMYKPSARMDPKAQEIHKLTPKILRKQPRFEACWDELEGLMKGKTILIQNASFDIRLLRQTCQRYGIESAETFQVKDTMPYFQEEVGVKALKKVLVALNIAHDDAKLHGAAEDCLKCVEALNKTIVLNPTDESPLNLF